MSSGCGAGPADRVSSGIGRTSGSKPLLGKRDLALFNLLSLIRILVFLFFGWQLLAELPRLPVGAAVAVLATMAGLVLDQCSWFLLPLARKANPAPARLGWRVAVVTTYAGECESRDMLAVTLQALAKLSYPHDTWLLDETNSDSVVALCSRLGVRHFTRKHQPSFNTAAGMFEAGSKHGNYNAWLTSVGYSRYDVLCAFDPDHVPVPSFLSEVLGYLDQENIGYVQAPQVYYNQHAGIVPRGAAEESYAYYSFVQMAAYAFGCPIVTGCHNTHRMEALRQVGGFAPHPADDLLLTRNYQASGWSGVYVPKILACGLTASDLSSYLVQQQRWARSVFDLKLRPGRDSSHSVTTGARVLGYLQGYRFLADSVVALSGFGLLLCCLAGYNVLPAIGSLAWMGAAAYITNLYKQRFYLDPKSEAGLHWRALIVRAAKWPYTLKALVDVIRNRRYPYEVTPKAAPPKSCVLWPQIVLLTAILAAWAGSGFSGRIHAWTVHAFAACTAASLLALVIWPMSAGPRRPFPESGEAVGKFRPRWRLARSAAWAFAVFLMLWSLRGAATSSPATRDSARHAMNGAFFHDLIRFGHLADPIGYAKWYHARLPALSMPYHPPLFPAIEAMGFLAFGIDTWNARLLVALFTALGALLWVELLIATHRSAILGLLCGAAFYLSPLCQFLSTDVMLEMPAIAICLGAILVLARTGDNLRWRSGWAYGILAGAGILTKQTVFLGVLLVLFPILSGRVRWFRTAPFWCASGCIGLAALSLVAMAWSVGWSGLPGTWNIRGLFTEMAGNLAFYLGQLPWVLLALFAGLALLFSRWRSIKRQVSKPARSLYVSWAASAGLVLVLLPAHDERYALFLIPPLLVLGAEIALSLLSAVLPPRAAFAVLALAASVFSVRWLSPNYHNYLEGTRQLAAHVHRIGYSRVLFCGGAGGNFIFEMRAAEQWPRTTVIRCDKLPESTFQPDAFRDFVHRYGIRAVVIQKEDYAANWLRFLDQPLPTMIFDGKWRLTGSAFNGELVLFRMTDPSPQPEKIVPIPINTFGKELHSL